ncbi:MAG: AI-2E family transporter [Candidatus Peribacteraceae bacterium]|nr:AI-2E family transporter [Candidatus Peribacteraceae bacterium]
MTPSAHRSAFFLLLLAGTVLLALRLFLPFLLLLSFAATLAVILQPLLQGVRGALKRDGIAAGVTVLLTLFLIILPLAGLLSQIAQEAAELYTQVVSGHPGVITDVIAFAERQIRAFAPGFSFDIRPYVGQIAGLVAGNLQRVLTGTFNTFFNLFLGILAYFYMLRDGPRFTTYLASISPLGTDETMRLFRRLELSINSIIRGSLTIALIQGVLTGIGLTIVGIPNPVLWASVAAVGALIPNIGTALVLIPAVAFLFITGHPFRGIGLTVWGAVAVGSIDNLLHPYLIGRGARIHPFFILFSIVGGLSVFGIAGFILGPLTVSLLQTLLEMYGEWKQHRNVPSPEV